MGDRGNIRVVSRDEDGNVLDRVYLYTHWDGYRLAETLQEALEIGKSRWCDGQYLARIIFCHMVKDEPEGKTTGYGISSTLCDNDAGNPILEVDPGDQVVRVIGRQGGPPIRVMPMLDFLELEDPSSWWREEDKE